MVAELYSYVSPGSVDYFTGGDSTTVGVGAAPQWATEDADTSYISFLPGEDFAIAAFDMGVTSCPGLTLEWFQNPRFIMQSQVMGPPDNVFFFMYMINDDNVFAEFFIEPFAGLYYSGQSAYATNVWYGFTEYPGPDPEDPHGEEITIDGDVYSAFSEYGVDYIIPVDVAEWADTVYALYLADNLRFEFWGGGGSGFQEPDDELRLSLFGFVLPYLTPNLTGAIEDKRRQFWRNTPY